MNMPPQTSIQITATQIPDWADASRPGLVHWWQDMAGRHLAFYPDDAPETVFSFTDGAPLFDAAASAKLRGILAAMFREHGNEVYRVAEEAVLALLESRAS